MKILSKKIKAFYSMKRTQKLAISAIVTTVVVCAVVFALLYKPVISSAMSTDVSNGTTVTKYSEKDKLAINKEKPRENDRKDKATSDEAKDDTTTSNDTNNGSTAPESKSSTASTYNNPTSNQTAAAHEHNWVPNMVTIPGQPPIYHHQHILGETQQWWNFKWADGCERKLREFTTADVDAEHTAQHGEFTFTATPEYIEVKPEVVSTLIQEEIPAHDEQRGWKCSCGATKE